MADQDAVAQLEPIPQPPAKPVVGNLLDLDAEMPILTAMELARTYGPIFQLTMPKRTLVFVSGHRLVDELCDESRFDKKVWTPLRNVRTFAGDGLFTAWTDEPNWHKAHNILMPNFSMKAMQGYLPMMIDIARQLMDKWARMNPDDEINVPEDMTRLTLDTIGLCGFDYRFNSFYRETPHPFVQSMVRALAESQQRTHRLPIQDKLMVLHHMQYQNDIKFMNQLVDRIIKERKESSAESSEKKDLLSYMLNGVDKQSGEKLDDVNIRYQIITFLIAGHETTSGLLSFAIYELLRNPAVLAKARAEVDRVLGRDLNVDPTFAQVNQLKYVSQVLKETLRLYPTAPAFALYPRSGEEIIGGKYRIVKEHMDVAVLTPMLHRDKEVWGEDAEKFNPDHFLPEREAQLPVNAYKPFGNGQRACIGRQFAMQEATLVLGMLLQRFNFVDHTNYQLKIKQTLTLKPDGFKIQVRPRTATERTATISITTTPVRSEALAPEPTTPIAVKQHNTPLLVLYGSNLGTAEELAHRIAEDGNARGFTVGVASLDEYANRLPKEGVVIIVTASYNGTPPDNAVKFHRWLADATLPADALKGVRYSVFGCGNHEWASTFQAIPRFIDSRLEQHGATRLYQRGEGDAADDFDGQFQSWYQALWPALAKTFAHDLAESSAPPKQLYDIEIVAAMPVPGTFLASFGARAMQVMSNRELHRKDGPLPSERSTRHIEIALPTGVSYKAGDHLGILAHNTMGQVERVARHFGFDQETRICIHKNDTRKTHLPVNEPVRVYTLLSDYVELQDVATRSQIKRMLEYTECPPEKLHLTALVGDDEASNALYRREVLAKHKSLIDLLEEFPSCSMPFSIYLELLAPIRPRYYSISSSPLAQPERCSITVGVVGGPAWSGHGTYQGLCSTYLSHLNEGDTVYAFVQDTKSRFRLPENAATPLIMVGPGTGLAPFRGFLQERAALKAQGQTIGQSLLFFGCRHPQQDFIYEDELRRYVEQGVTELYVAFSRLGEQKVYVQDQIREESAKVWQLLQNGAVIYVCGDASKMAPDVRNAFVAIYQQQTGCSKAEAERWLDELTEQNRYLVDVWGN